VQTLIETMMTGNVVPPFSCKRTQRRRPWTKQSPTFI
jgi:hypothetical protein